MGTPRLTDRHVLSADWWHHAFLVADSRTGRYVGASPSAEDLFGYSLQELLALGPRDLTPSEERPRLAAAVAALERTSRWEGVWQLRRKDGSILATEAVTRVVPVAGGRVLYQGFFRDPTMAPPLVQEKLAQLEQLYEVHARFVLGYAFGVLRDQAEAEEVAQEALLIGWRAG